MQPTSKQASSAGTQETQGQENSSASATGSASIQLLPFDDYLRQLWGDFELPEHLNKSPTQSRTPTETNAQESGESVPASLDSKDILEDGRRPHPRAVRPLLYRRSDIPDQEFLMGSNRAAEIELGLTRGIMYEVLKSKAAKPMSWIVWTPSRGGSLTYHFKLLNPSAFSDELKKRGGATDETSTKGQNSKRSSPFVSSQHPVVVRNSNKPSYELRAPSIRQAAERLGVSGGTMQRATKNALNRMEQGQDRTGWMTWKPQTSKLATDPVYLIKLLRPGTCTAVSERWDLGPMEQEAMYEDSQVEDTSSV